MNPPVSDLALQAHETLRDVRAMTVAVVGLGYVGLPTTLSLVDAGFDVVGIDISRRRLDAISRGEVDLADRDRERLAAALKRGRVALHEDTAAIADADAVIIAVPTPVDDQLEPDPRAVHAACDAVVAHAQRGQTIVLTSTTYVGTTRRRLAEPLAERGLVAGEDVYIAFAPERINPGETAWEQAQVPRVLGGMTPVCAQAAERVLAPTAKLLHIVGSAEAAELTKLFENTFRAVNLALVNEIAGAARHHDVDPIEVIDAAATKPYGFLAHYPSAGVGGHCIAVDPHYLLHPVRERGRPAAVAEEALRKIAGRPRHVAVRAHEVLVELGKALPDARILVVGASYKPGVADTREAPSLELIARLRAQGAQVDYHDPLVQEIELDGERIAGVDPDPRRDASGFGPEDYDLAILATVHPDRDYGWLARCQAVLDCTYRHPIGRLRFLL
jgi:nucleotide sugar dehydrogenase